MLILTRKQSETIKIDKDVTIIVQAIRGNRVKIGIEAPKEKRILRGEIKDDAA